MAATIALSVPLADVGTPASRETNPEQASLWKAVCAAYAYTEAVQEGRPGRRQDAAMIETSALIRAHVANFGGDELEVMAAVVNSANKAYQDYLNH